MLGPLVPIIDAILEADKTAPPKQRRTAKRTFERLRIEHGFAYSRQNRIPTPIGESSNVSETLDLYSRPLHDDSE
jgi:hypothetical protein